MKILFRWLELVIALLVKHKKLLILIAVCFFTAMGVSALFRGGIGPPPRRTDLTVFLRAAESVKSGGHIYLLANARGWHYMYLPLFAIILVPFTSLPLLVNTSLWYLASVGAFFGMFFLSTALIKDRTISFKAAVGASLFSLPPLVEMLTRAQVDLLLSFMAVAVLFLFLRNRPVWAGLLLAFAVTLKVSPLAPLVIFFLVKREWKLCASFVAGMLLFVVAFPSVALGAERNFFLLTEWNRIMSHAVSDSGHESHLWGQLVNPFAEDNQCLYAALTRWFWPSESVLRGNSNDLIRWGTRLFGALQLGLLAFFCKKSGRDLSRRRIVLEYSLFTVLMFLVSPVASLHHYIILYVMYFAAFLYMQDLDRQSAPYKWLFSGILLSFSGFLLGYCFRNPFGYWGFPIMGTAAFWWVLFLFSLHFRPGILKGDRPVEDGAAVG